MGSGKFSLNLQDVAKVGKNAMFVGIAAGLAYIGQNITNIDLGAASAFIVPIIVLAIDTASKWAKDNTKE